MPEEPEKSKQSKGGAARAKRLTPERRSEIARAAAAAKHDTPKATHEGPLQIGDITLECAVLEDGTRVISQSNFMEAMGIYYSGWLAKDLAEDEGTAEMPLHLPFKRLKPYIEKHFGAAMPEVLHYRPKGRGNVANGLRAEMLPKVCEVWLDARNDKVLVGSRQKLIAEKADLLIRGFAHVGIIALIDEATGFQYERQRDALQELLKEFLSDRLRKWVRTFPSAYFRELCRLKGVVYRPDMKLPQYFGHFTNDIVYKRLAPGLRKELEERNPRDEDGKRKAKNHQWLSEEVGHPRLLQHLGGVVSLMRISEDWETFKAHLDKVAPVYGDETLFNYKRHEEDEPDPE